MRGARVHTRARACMHYCHTRDGALHGSVEQHQIFAAAKSFRLEYTCNGRICTGVLTFARARARIKPRTGGAQVRASRGGFPGLGPRPVAIGHGLHAVATYVRSRSKLALCALPCTCMCTRSGSRARGRGATRSRSQSLTRRLLASQDSQLSNSSALSSKTVARGARACTLVIIMIMLPRRRVPAYADLKLSPLHARHGARRVRTPRSAAPPPWLAHTLERRLARATTATRACAARPSRGRAHQLAGHEPVAAPRSAGAAGAAASALHAAGLVPVYAAHTAATSPSHPFSSQNVPVPGSSESVTHGTNCRAGFGGGGGGGGEGGVAVCGRSSQQGGFPPPSSPAAWAPLPCPHSLLPSTLHPPRLPGEGAPAPPS